MATKIRLKRIGRRNRPFYRLIIIDSRKRRDGLAIEQVGWYDPLKKDKDTNFSLKEDRILAWLQLGAQVSDPVNKLMKRSGLAYRWHLMSQGLSPEDIEKAVAKWKEERLEVLKNRKKANNFFWKGIKYGSLYTKLKSVAAYICSILRIDLEFVIKKVKY